MAKPEKVVTFWDEEKVNKWLQDQADKVDITQRNAVAYGDKESGASIGYVIWYREKDVSDRVRQLIS